MIKIEDSETVLEIQKYSIIDGVTGPYGESKGVYSPINFAGKVISLAIALSEPVVKKAKRL